MSDENYDKTIIEVAEYGPYIVRGLKSFKNSRGENIVNIPVMALCRCGKSSSKPFCDGSHTQMGFKGEKLSGRVEDKLNLDKELGIIIRKNGPFSVVGGPELKDTDGNNPESHEHYSLCRCGGSKNKPFCDGTHYKIKFKAEKN